MLGPSVRPEDLIREADTSMYKAKWAGRDRVEVSERCWGSWIHARDVTLTPDSAPATMVRMENERFFAGLLLT